MEAKRSCKSRVHWTLCGRALLGLPLLATENRRGEAVEGELEEGEEEGCSFGVGAMGG